VDGNHVEDDNDFESWTLATWNRRLVRGYLLKPTENGLYPPLEAIQTSRTLFARAVDITTRARDADLALPAFCEQLRKHAQGRELDRDALRLVAGWSPLSDVAPPFWSHLVFTCYVAATSELTEADFRKRSKELLEDSHTQTFSVLSNLWEAVRDWSQHQSIKTGTCRVLKLTDGPFRRIGYSLRLAFPSRMDNQVLTEILEDEQLLRSEPPVERVIKLLDRLRKSFTPPFRDAFDSFRAAYASGAPATSHDRFWSAVREAAYFGEASVPIEAEWTALLCEDPGPRFSLEIASPQRLNKLPWTTEDAEYTELGLYSVGFRGQGEGGRNAAVEQILEAGSGPTPAGGLLRAAEAGVLVFQYADVGISIFRSRFPTEGPVSLLAKGRIVSELAIRFRRRPHESIHPGWFVVSGLTTKDLSDHRNVFPKTLRESTFEQIAPPKVISIREGIWATTGSSVYLGLPELLPTIHLEGASSVIMLSGHGPSIPLDPGEAPGDWQLPSGAYEGAITLEGYKDGTKIAARRIEFSTTYFGDLNCMTPVSRSDWWQESPSGYFVDASETQPARTSGASFNADSYKLSFKPHPSDVVSVKRHRQLIALMIAFASLLSHKRGISITEAVQWFTRILELPTYQAWQAMRSWQESSRLERLWARRWRGSRLFGIDSHLVIFRGCDHAQAVTLGLFYPVLLDRMLARCSEMGIAVTAFHCASPYVPPLYRLEGGDAKALEDVALTLGISFRYLPPPSAADLALPPRLIKGGEIDAPLSGSDAEIEKIAEWRSDGQSFRLAKYSWTYMLDRYVIHAESKTLQFYSRSTALVAAHRLGALTIFTEEYDGQLTMNRFDSYLPIGAALYGYLFPSTRPLTEAYSDYFYDFGTASLRATILASILPYPTNSRQAHALAVWIALLARSAPSWTRGNLRLIPNSAELHASHPALAHELERTGLPVFLIPWIITLLRVSGDK
jgi:hypothetical protein